MTDRWINRHTDGKVNAMSPPSWVDNEGGLKLTSADIT